MVDAAGIAMIEGAINGISSLDKHSKFASLARSRHNKKYKDILVFEEPTQNDEAFRWADVILDIGGLCSNQRNKYDWLRLRKKHEVPYVWMSQSFYSIDPVLLEGTTIICRGSRTAKKVTDAGFECRVAPDLSFLIEPKKWEGKKYKRLLTTHLGKDISKIYEIYDPNTDIQLIEKPGFYKSEIYWEPRLPIDNFIGTVEESFGLVESVDEVHSARYQIGCAAILSSKKPCMYMKSQNDNYEMIEYNQKYFDLLDYYGTPREKLVEYAMRSCYAAVEAAQSKVTRKEASSIYLQKSESNIQQAIQLELKGNLDEAIELYFQAINNNPKFHWSYIKLGEVLVKQNKLDEAINQFRMAIQISPNGATAYYNLAKALTSQGNNNEAVFYFRQAIKKLEGCKASVPQSFYKSLNEALEKSSHKNYLYLDKPNISKSIYKIPDQNLCNFCGACEPVCPIENCITTHWENGVPIPKVNEETCINCGICSKVCCGEKLPKNVETLAAENPFKGKCLGAYVGHIKKTDYRQGAQSGGIASGLLIYALQSKIVDKVLLPIMEYGNPPRAKATLTDSIDDILSSRGSIYLPVPLMSKLKEINEFDGTVGIIGLSCHNWTLRAAYNIWPKLQEKIKFTIGLICSGVLRETMLKEHLQQRNNLDIQEPYKVYFRSKRFASKTNAEIKTQGHYPPVLETQSGKVHVLSYEDRATAMHSYKPERCATCLDMLNVLSDITIGDPHHLAKYNIDIKRGESALIVRSQRGKQLIDSCDSLALRSINYEEFYNGQIGKNQKWFRQVFSRRQELEEQGMPVSDMGPGWTFENVEW